MPWQGLCAHEYEYINHIVTSRNSFTSMLMRFYATWAFAAITTILGRKQFGDMSRGK